jgi:hypothetical protein
MYVKPKEQFQEDSHSDQVLFIHELSSYLKTIEPSEVYLYVGVDSDSGL